MYRQFQRNDENPKQDRHHPYTLKWPSTLLNQLSAHQLHELFSLNHSLSTPHKNCGVSVRLETYQNSEAMRHNTSDRRRQSLTSLTKTSSAASLYSAKMIEQQQKKNDDKDKTEEKDEKGNMELTVSFFLPEEAVSREDKRPETTFKTAGGEQIPTKNNMPKSPNFLSSIPLTVRPMKILLVFPYGCSLSSDALLKAWKSAAEELNMAMDVGFSAEQMRHYYNHTRHDVILIDRRRGKQCQPDTHPTADKTESMKMADELCQWIRKHDMTPCAIVAMEDSVADEEVPCNMKELIKLGYDLSIQVTEKSPHCVQHLLQLEHNNFHWWLRMEAVDALRLALDNVADPVEIVDNQFRMQYVNLAYERLLGNSREKLIGQRIPSFLNPPVSLFNSGPFTHKSADDPPNSASHQVTSPPSVPSSVNISPTAPVSNLTDDPSYARLQFRRGSTGSGQQTTIPFPYPSSNTTKTPNKPQLSTSSTFILGRPTLASSVRRKSMPETHHNTAPVRFFPVHSKDGRIIHYVTIRSSPQHAGGVYLAELLNGAPSNMPFIYQSYPPRDRYSFTIEAPIHKVISILSSAQQYSNISVAQELQKVLDILQTTDLYATQKQSVVACREVDPATTDLVEGLLTSSRIFTSEADTRRRSNPHTGLIKRPSRPSEIMTQHIQQVLDNVSNNRINLLGIPEDVSESLEGDDRWDYDILRLEEVTVKRPLKFLALRICERFSVVEVLNTSETTLANWLTVVEDHYRQSNTYHNATHAADVMQSSAYFLERDSLKEIFGPYDEVATILASIVHDMDHPGRTNPFLINSRNRLAILYNDMAVLENHHVSLCYQLTDKDERINIFKNLSREDFQLMRQCIIDMVLATEMAKHFEHLTKFMNVVQKKTSLVGHGRDASLKMTESFTTDSLSQQRRTSGQAGLYVSNMSVEDIVDPHEEWLEYARKPECRANIRRILIKCSDISNPTRPLRLCKIWAERIAEEYFSQTDDEKMNNLPVVMPWFDRHTCNIPKSQLSFIDVFLKGMIEAWDNFLDVPELVDNLNTNHAYWTALLTNDNSVTVTTAMTNTASATITAPSSKIVTKKDEEENEDEEGSNIVIDFDKSKNRKDT